MTGVFVRRLCSAVVFGPERARTEVFSAFCHFRDATVIRDATVKMEI
jgi:hypothetical protein